MRIGSLFSGIGGLDLACEWALGGHTVWQLDQVGADVRARHWPKALQVTADVATVDPRTLPKIDVLAAGFACQDLSNAGRGASKEDLLAGVRTGSTYAHMLRFVRALKPKRIVLENVIGLLKHRRRVEADLRGYGLTWVKCAASDVGAPHKRQRVFVLATLGGAHCGVLEAPVLQDCGPARTWSTLSAGNFNETESPLQFHARRERLREKGSNGNGMGEPLGQQVQLWPTLTVCGNDNVKGLSPTSGDGLATAVRPWMTLTSRDYRSAGGLAHTNGGDALNDQVMKASGTVDRLWGTLTASEADGRRTSKARRADPDLLSEQLRLWGTLRVGNGGTGGQRENDRGRIEDQVVVHNPNGPTLVAGDADDIKANGVGSPSLNFEVRQRTSDDQTDIERECGGPSHRLNPEWCEILMGFPIGWTATMGDRLVPERRPRWPVGRYPKSWDRTKPWPQDAWEPTRSLPPGAAIPGRPARIRGLGNAVVPQQGAHALEVALALPTQGGLFG